MTDCISRQAAIDEIEERKNANGYRNVAVISELNRLEGYIMRLPSAQPETCGDVINREYLKEHIEACWINGRPRYAPELNELLSWIDDVPSAQQERKTGQWIKRKNGAIGYNCSCCGKSDISNHFDYCPNCGADMRGKIEC